MENTLRLAEISELKGIVHIFQSWRTVFPHVRQDYIKRKILASECVYQEGVVITFNRYKVKVTLGTVTIPKGSYIIHQIVNAKQGNGCASRVLDRLCDVVARDSEDVYLTVREDNTLARAFYRYKRFEEAGEITWANGALPGMIYRKPTSRVSRCETDLD